MPMPSPKMKIGSMMLFDITVKSVRPIANLGLPAARMTLLSPKYRWVNTLPSRIISMYCRA